METECESGDEHEQQHLLKDLKLSDPLHMGHQLCLVVIRCEGGPEACLQFLKVQLTNHIKKRPSEGRHP